MKLTLQRFGHGRHTTLGRLLIDGEHQCFTLEDEHRAKKVPAETRIPDGSYKVTLRTEGGFHARYAKRFGKLHRGMLWLRDVPGFEYILIHIGNTEDDTAGCILVGRAPAVSAAGEFSVKDSSGAYIALYARVAAELVAGEDVVIDIVSLAR